VNAAELAAIEFGTVHLGAPIVLILGHS
jgi:hypothetical protein